MRHLSVAFSLLGGGTMFARVILVLIVAAGAVFTGLGPSAGAGAPLYPDLQTLPPTGLRFDTVTLGDGKLHHVLRFDNTVWNAGPGRLELEGRKRSKIYQRVYDAATGGTLVERTYLGNDGLFHAGHNHYHLENFASYVLLTTDGTELGRGTKTSFCVIDYVNITAQYNPQYTSCGRSIQGLSVGWGDTYHANLAEQWVDLGVAGAGTSPPLNGTYVLSSTANPGNAASRQQLLEADYGNNEGRTCFTVTNGAIAYC